ncbi:hypothetical protein CEUSTIGMA_g10193.t1 [Chlamydomonas eustigma]|uniref:EF-hand domain-containing protein n=1 Tax=Chlamydomonas eustigma TaxID=1157962 RepID=A0A250XI52_9CHLO|nr:hypothetical protein CEUSTIGMA_g10193.t1 [Chlamydomonas eustigma]|eukprot:GAX82767.1 hypothetical protein CEUSTIGMA_g10193.t1 [Chlamydomonas eustigma]
MVMTARERNGPPSEHFDAVSTLSPNLKLDIREYVPTLHIDIAKWLKKHGKLVRPKLTDRQREELEQVFKLMDDDGSGAIDVEELGAAFKLLGFQLTKNEILELMKDVDEDQSGELDFSGFLEIMTHTLHQMTEQKKKGDQIPFALMATAYRRKKILEDVLVNTQQSLGGIVQTGIDDEERAKEHETARKVAEAEAEARAALGVLANMHPNGDLMRTSEMTKLDPLLLADTFGKEELHAVAQLYSLKQKHAHRAGDKKSCPSLPFKGAYSAQKTMVLREGTGPALSREAREGTGPALSADSSAFMSRKGSVQAKLCYEDNIDDKRMKGVSLTTHRATESGLTHAAACLSAHHISAAHRVSKVCKHDVLPSALGLSRNSYPQLMWRATAQTSEGITRPGQAGRERVTLPTLLKHYPRGGPIGRSSCQSVGRYVGSAESTIIKGLTSADEVWLLFSKKPVSSSSSVMLPVKGKRLPLAVLDSLPALPTLKGNKQGSLTLLGRSLTTL